MHKKNALFFHSQLPTSHSPNEYYYIYGMLKIFPLLAMALVACNVETEPKILLGHEWNSTAKVVVDTTSQFKANDIIIVQMDNGGRFFTSNSVELRVYQGETDRILFKRAIDVKKQDTKAVLKGPDSKPLTARELMRTSTPGTYRIAFAVGDSILLEKKLELVK